MTVPVADSMIPYISLKIPGIFSRPFFQISSEWLHMEVPY